MRTEISGDHKPSLSVGWRDPVFEPLDGEPIPFAQVVSVYLTAVRNGAFAVVETGDPAAFAAMKPGRVGAFRVAEKHAKDGDAWVQHEFPRMVVACKSRHGTHEQFVTGTVVMVEV